MVFAEDIAPSIATPVAPRRPAFSSPPTSTRLYCRRCDARLIMGYDEPQCLTCGYADYTHSRDIMPRWSRTSIVSTATRYVIRYVGDSINLSDRLTHIRLVRHRNRAIYAVNCPFCEKSMDESSLSGKRPVAREQRYKCADGHRVSLIPGKNDVLGWR